MMRFLKVILGLACWVCDRFATPVGRRRPRPIVLYYHDVPTQDVKRFERQMEIIRSRMRPVALSNLDVCQLDRAVAVTFDDSLLSFARHAVPILHEKNIPATVFAVASLSGRRPDWHGAQYSPEERVMSSELVKQLPGLISVGSHTMTHRNLAEASSEDALWELAESRRTLEKVTGGPIEIFSFPYGSHNEVLVKMCQQVGYRKVFTSQPETVCVGQYAIGRFGVDPSDSWLEFRLKLAGAYRWLPFAIAAKRVALDAVRYVKLN